MDSTTILVVMAVILVFIAMCMAAVVKRWQHKDGHADGGEGHEECVDVAGGSSEDGTQVQRDFSGMKTRQLCKALLHELNCKITEDEDDHDRMEFLFQGETFCLIGSDESLMVTVYDFSWGSVPLDDIDEVSRLRKTINSVNFRFGGLSVVYSIDTDHNRMVVHSKRQFLLTPEIPNIVEYMTAMLTGFFEIQRALTHELDRLRMEAGNGNKKNA